MKYFIFPIKREFSFFVSFSFYLTAKSSLSARSKMFGNLLWPDAFIIWVMWLFVKKLESKAGVWSPIKTQSAIYKAPWALIGGLSIKVWQMFLPLCSIYLLSFFPRYLPEARPKLATLLIFMAECSDAFCAYLPYRVNSSLFSPPDCESSKEFFDI